MRVGRRRACREPFRGGSVRQTRADSAPAKGVRALGWCDQVFFLDPEEWFGGGGSDGERSSAYASLISTSSRRV
jgi:hypothetical protein